MSLITGIKCPSCGANMRVKGGGVVVCSHCGTTSMVQRPAPAQSVRAMRRELKAAEENVKMREGSDKSDRREMTGFKPAMRGIHQKLILCGAFLLGLVIWVGIDPPSFVKLGCIPGLLVLCFAVGLLLVRGRVIEIYNSDYESVHDPEHVAALGQAKMTAADLRRRLSNEEGQND